MSILRHLPQLKRREDRRSIAAVVLNLLFLLGLLKFQPSGVLFPLAIAMAWLLCFISCLVTHNHKHTSIFVGHFANRVFDFLLTAAAGRSATGIVLPHNLNHHVYNNTPEDWIRVSLAGTGWGIFRWIRYTFAAIGEMFKKRNQVPQSRAIQNLQKLRIAEQLFATGVFLLAATWQGPWVAAAYLGLPWVLGLFTLVAANFPQHDGIPAGAQWPGRDFVSPFLNYILLNNGYHIAHHLKPSMHWADLPEFSRKNIYQSLPEEQRQTSFWRFVLRRYILS